MAYLMVVDDDEGVRDLLHLILEREGYAVRSVASVAEAMEALTPESVDLILCDFQLPDGTGVDLYRWVRRINGTPFVFVTGGRDRPQGGNEAFGLLAARLPFGLGQALASQLLFIRGALRSDPE